MLDFTLHTPDGDLLAEAESVVALELAAMTIASDELRDAAPGAARVVALHRDGRRFSTFTYRRTARGVELVTVSA